MPVAYVKFISGPMNGKKTIVDVKSIRHFKKEVHRSNVKYTIQYNNHECCGVILLLGESKEEIEKLMENQRRLSNLPSRLLISASSTDNDSDIENKGSKSSASTTSADNKNVLMENRLQKKLANLKSNQSSKQKHKSSYLTDLKNHPSNGSKTCDNNTPKKHSKDDGYGENIVSENNTIAKVDKQEENNLKSISKKKTPPEYNDHSTNGEEKKEESLLFVDDANTNNEEENQLVNDKEKEKEILVQSKVNSSVLSSSVVEFKKSTDDNNESEKSASIENKEKKIQETEKNSQQVQPKVLQNEPIKLALKVVKSTANRNSSAMKSSDIHNDLKEKIKNFKSEIVKLNKRKSELKAELEEKRKEIKRLMELNENLQTHLLEKCEEQKDKLEELEKVKNQEGSYDSNFPNFLRTRITDNIRRVHIGNDEWIPEIAFNRIKSKSFSARQLAGNIVIAVFDEDILLTSTITGHESNKKGKDKNKNRVGKLDEKKLNACERLYEYLLEELFSKFKSTKKVKGKIVKVTINDEQGLFQYYAQKKIADLKNSRSEDQSTSNKKKRKRELDSDESTVKKVCETLDEDKLNEEVPADPSNSVVQEDSDHETVETENQNTETVEHNVESKLYDWSPVNSSGGSTTIASCDES